MNMPNVLSRIPKSVKLAILIVLAAKVLVFGLGYFAYAGSPDQTDPSVFTILTHQFARPLAPQDGPHYLDIAKNWYTGDPTLDASNFIVFFPLFPLLIRLVAVDLSYSGLSAAALIVSNVSSLIALAYLYKLAKLDFSDGVALKAVLFLSIFPTAYFLSAPYTEGLFFALTISSLYYARLNKWPLAGFLGFFAALTRLGGLLMLPILAVEYLHQRGWNIKRIQLNVIWIFGALAGFLVYLNINSQVWGNALKFMEIEHVHWYNTLDPILGLTRTLGWANNGVYPQNLILGYAPIIFAVFGLVLIGVGFWRRFRPSYMAVMVLSWMLAVSTSMWISVPRYVMAMFPMFILLGTLTQRKVVNLTIAVVFAVSMGYFTVMFALGNFVF
jgi:hypothetical protein